MVSFTALCLSLALVGMSAAAYNSTQMAEIYINLGSGEDPSVVNCTTYSSLFTSTGLLHQPGVPDVSGTADLQKACEADHAELDPLVAFQTLNIPVNSWDMSKRTAFRWTINGVRTSDHTTVSAPAISAFFQDKTGKIKEAWSFYDTGVVSGQNLLGKPKATYNASKIVQQYIRLGGSATLLPPTNCDTWVSLYSTDGVNNEPGVPPNTGKDKLTALCQLRAKRWKTLAPVVNTEIPVLTWDMHGRVAFEWTLAGVSATGDKAVVPAITVFFLDTDGKITNSWDWWNTDLIPN